MAEIEKITKISLIAYAIVTLLYGIMYIFLSDVLLGVAGWTDPMTPRVFGGICLLSSLYAFILLRKKEWEDIKLTYSYLFGLFIPTIIVNISTFAVLFPTLNTGTISQYVMGLVFMSILFALGLYSYMKQIA